MNQQPDQLDVQVHVVTTAIRRRVAALNAAVDRWTPRPMPTGWRR